MWSPAWRSEVLDGLSSNLGWRTQFSETYATRSGLITDMAVKGYCRSLLKDRAIKFMVEDNRLTPDIRYFHHQTSLEI